MKKFGIIVLGFFIGLIISGILGDIIIAINNYAGRMSAASNIAKAERLIAGDNFDQALCFYEKALKKIKPENKILTAKVKNNMALCTFTIADNKKDAAGIEKSISMFLESLEIYKELKDVENAKQVEININEAEAVLNKLKQ